MSEPALRYAAVLPGGTATAQLEQAVLAEQSGWDGVFVPEIAYGTDPWSLLAAIAMRTSRIRLGTMLTPLPWRRPWKLASQVATVHQLSGGRAILAVGIGAADEARPATGEITGVRERAERLDEGIDLIRALWAGQKSFRGQHYQYDGGQLDLAADVAPGEPGIPLWVVGLWPRPKSMRRVLRCDGIIPQYSLDGREAGPADARAVRDWLDTHAMPAGFDLISEGETPAGDPAAAAAQVLPWAEAGCTWWLETRWAGGPAEMRSRLAAGPPGRP
jgi:hypothetical protein